MSDLIEAANGICTSLVFTYPVTDDDIIALQVRFYTLCEPDVLSVRLVDGNRVVIMIVDEAMNVLYRHTMIVDGVPDDD